MKVRKARKHCTKRLSPRPTLPFPSFPLLLYEKKRCYSTINWNLS